MTFLCKKFVLSLSQNELCELIRQSILLISLKPQRHLSLTNWEILVAFSLLIKSTLLLALT